MSETQEIEVGPEGEVNLDDFDIPDNLETLEDYMQVRENFILPLFYRQAKKMSECIVELHNRFEKEEMSEEQINVYMQQLIEHASYASEESVLAPFLDAVIELEDKLEKEGAISFTDIEEN